MSAMPREKSKCATKMTQSNYDDLEEMQPIAVDDGFVTFCHHYKYLGPVVSFNATIMMSNIASITAATLSPIHGSSEECLELSPP